MSTLVIDIVDLPRQVGSAKAVHLDLVAPEGLGTEVIGAAPGTPLVIDATLTSVDDGVLVRGGAQAHVHAECVRCLRDIDQERRVSFDELYYLPEAAAAQRAEGDEEADDVFLLGDTSLDLEPALRDALVLDLPLRPLCREDCAGLCPHCGERLDDLPAGHHHEVLDPRWSALAGLLGEDPAPGGAPDGQGQA
ncbi:YceD family protein [Actinomyces sp. W5033]|uniref:YceD family protein n=1 Tax=Actinomyces sp. W5033 TaxID=3446479 RepID=UPI003EDFDE0B